MRHFLGHGPLLISAAHHIARPLLLLLPGSLASSRISLSRSFCASQFLNIHYHASTSSHPHSLSEFNLYTNPARAVIRQIKRQIDPEHIKLSRCPRYHIRKSRFHSQDSRRRQQLSTETDTRFVQYELSIPRRFPIYPSSPSTDTRHQDGHHGFSPLEIRDLPSGAAIRPPWESHHLCCCCCSIC